MRILRISHVFYKKPLSNISLKIKKAKSYQEICNYIQSENLVGLADFSSELTKKGIPVLEIFYDSIDLQRFWCNLNTICFDGDPFVVLKNQISIFKPDVIFITSPHLVQDYFIKEIKDSFSFVRFFVAHKGTPFSYQFIKNYNLVYVATPFMLQEASSFNKNVKLFYHYYSGAPVFLEDRNTCFSFLGSSGYNWGFNHASRYWYLLNLLNTTKIDVFLDENLSPVKKFKYFIKYHLAKFSGLKFPRYFDSHFENNILLTKPYYPLSTIFGKRIKPPLFGKENAKKIQNSLIVFHKHTDDAKGYSGAMRLFEVTGNGACLLTDYTKNIHDLFPPDSIVTYKNFKDLLVVINDLLKDQRTVLRIAKRGHEHLKKNHLVANRVEMFLDDLKTLETSL